MNKISALWNNNQEVQRYYNWGQEKRRWRDTKVRKKYFKP